MTTSVRSTLTPTTMMRRRFWRVAAVLGLLAAIVATSVNRSPEPSLIVGPTMGTVYRVTISASLSDTARRELEAAIEARLARINGQMSTYDPQSDISQFNRAVTTDWQDVPLDVVRLVQQSADVSVLSGGRFDVTVGPLVNLWGFGPERSPDRRPHNTEIEAALSLFGYEQLEYRFDPPGLRKRTAGMIVDLSAIAKGFAVDEVSDLLASMGHRDHLVEIGGELRARGFSADGDAWEVGIERPEAGARTLATTIALREQGIATSGDYRNIRMIDGQVWSHGIDVRTGYPLTHAALSVTVVHDSTAMADAWATALLVTPLDEARALAEEHELSVLFIFAEGRAEHRFQEWQSSAFAAQLDGAVR